MRANLNIFNLDERLLWKSSDDVVLNPGDLRVDVYHASGPGGQCVNTTSSAVRITHVPSGFVATCQDERSQTRNKILALENLKKKIFDAEQSRRDKIQHNAWKSSLQHRSKPKSSNNSKTSKANILHNIAMDEIDDVLIAINYDNRSIEDLIDNY